MATSCGRHGNCISRAPRCIAFLETRAFSPTDPATNPPPGRMPQACGRLFCGGKGFPGGTKSQSGTLCFQTRAGMQARGTGVASQAANRGSAASSFVQSNRRRRAARDEMSRFGVQHPTQISGGVLVPQGAQVGPLSRVTLGTLHSTEGDFRLEGVFPLGRTTFAILA